VYKIFSVDDHIIEAPDLWTSRLPARLGEVAPHVVQQDERQFWAYEDRLNTEIGLNAVAGKPRSEWNMEPARFGDMIPGCYDPKNRAVDLLSQGVLASVNFPTVPRFAGTLFCEFGDTELAGLCVQAWNDYVIDEWCPAGPPGLFVPGIICQLWDPPAAADEIARCVSKGARTLFFPENPVWRGLPSLHDLSYWEPVWAICQEADVALSLHVGSGGWVPPHDEQASFSAAIAAGEVSSILALVNLLISDVPVRYPRLKFAFSEGGVGWIPAVLARSDRQLDRHAGWAGRRPMKPSEVFAQSVWCCMVEEPLGLSFYPHIGAHKILCETDYPHADSTFPRSQASFAEVFRGIPDDVVEMVSHRNAEQVFHWQMADEALLSSPDVVTWRSELDADPQAALALRHDVENVRVLSGSQRRCLHLSARSNILTPCGARLGLDGICSEGHLTEAADALR
jgi:predicted TIM-barrel fold metal-dependent hydrolase